MTIYPVPTRAPSRASTRVVLRHHALPGIAIVCAIAGIWLGTGCGSAATRKWHPSAADFQTRGARAIRDGQLDRAAGLFSLALEYEPQMAPALNGLGVVAREHGNRSTAEDHFRRALAADDEFAEAHLNLGWLVFTAPEGVEDDQVRKALDHFERALAIDPGYGAARLAVALARLRLGRAEDAVWDLYKLVEVEPENPHGQAVLALCLARLGRMGAAEHAAQRALELDRSNTVAHRARGEILRAGGNLKAAAAAFRRALEGDPGNVEDRLALATVLIAAGRAKEAAVELERLNRAAPNVPEVAFTRAYLLVEQGTPRLGIAEAERALQLRADYPHARLILIRGLLDIENTTRARIEMKRFLDSSPQSLATERDRVAKMLARPTTEW